MGLTTDLRRGWVKIKRKIKRKGSVSDPVAEVTVAVSLMVTTGVITVESMLQKTQTNCRQLWTIMDTLRKKVNMTLTGICLRLRSMYTTSLVNQSLISPKIAPTVLRLRNLVVMEAGVVSTQIRMEKRRKMHQMIE